MTASGTRLALRAAASQSAYWGSRSAARLRNRSRPYVWSGRASEEVCQAAWTVLHKCIGLCLELIAPGHHGYQRVCDPISGQASQRAMRVTSVLKHFRGLATRDDRQVCHFHAFLCLAASMLWMGMSSQPRAKHLDIVSRHCGTRISSIRFSASSSLGLRP